MGPCLFVLVTALDRQGQRGGVPAVGLTGLARGEERFAKAVERLGLTRGIAGLAVKGQRLPEMTNGLVAVTLPQLGNAQASQGPGLAQLATDLAAHSQGSSEMAGGLRVVPLPQLEFTEVAQHIGLAPTASASCDLRPPWCPEPALRVRYQVATATRKTNRP